MSDSNIVPFKPRGDAPAGRDVSFEVALDDYPEPSELVPVDPEPEPGSLLPVRPAALQTWEGFKRETRRYAGRQVHRAKYHSLRSPWYLLQALFWAVIGGLVLVWRWLRWWLFPVPAAVHVDAVADGHNAWKATFKVHKETAKTRAKISAAVVAVLAVAGVLVWVYLPWWAWILLIWAVLVLLAKYGHPKDRPILRPAMVTPRFRVLNADIVLRAYYAAGLGHPEKPDQQITFPPPPMKRDGDGSTVNVDLPYGKTLKDAVDVKERIASGLDVQISQVFLHRDPTSTRRHRLWVADRDPLAVPVGRTPLLACKQADVWKQAPLGLDERGQLVQLLLMWNSILVGGMPRQGKSWTSRLLALFAALDPYVQLDVFDAGGKPDWRKFALVANSCAFGLTPTREGKPPELLLARLQALRADVEDRYERLSALPTSVCPQGKLTRKIARDPQFGMPVRLLILGEVQEYFLLGPISTEIAALLVYLVKVAPGAGVIVLADTQRPSGIGTGNIATQFVNFRDQHQVRFALRTPSYGVSDLVLGDGAYSMGLDSSKLLVEYKGVGILRGATDANPTTRCYYADDGDAEKILTAARGLRERAGTLSGMAAGVEFGTPARDVLADVLAVFDSDTGLHWGVLAARLEKRFPERYGDITADSISAQLRDLGVPVRQVKMFGQNLNGCRKADIEAVMGQR